MFENVSIVCAAPDFEQAGKELEKGVKNNGVGFSPKVTHDTNQNP